MHFSMGWKYFDVYANDLPDSLPREAEHIPHRSLGKLRQVLGDSGTLKLIFFRAFSSRALDLKSHLAI